MALGDVEIQAEDIKQALLTLYPSIPQADD